MMLRGPGHDSGGVLTGSALVQWLMRLTDARSPEPRRVFADKLSHWLGWADAISLSSALSSSPPPATDSTSGNASEQEAARVRAMLAKGHAAAVQDNKANFANTASAPDAANFLPFRRRYHERQQAMDLALGPLRTRLRAELAGRSAALARLAAVDGVMAQVVGERERTLLAKVPVLLEKRFEQLRQAAVADTTSTADAGRGGAPWPHTFHQDMLGVLLAELDLRFQPVEGLLAALRRSSAPGGTPPQPASVAPPSPLAPSPSR